MMNPFQMMQILQNSQNPMGAIQNMASQNPMLARALQMGQGKDVNQLQQTVRNIARQRGMTDEQLQQFLGQYGLKI